MSKRTTDYWEALLDGTTPGPWHVGGKGADGNTYVGNYDPDIGGPTASTGSDDAPLVAAAPEAVAEVVRLRRALEEQIKELNDELEAEEVETHADLDGTWPSMQRYGELSEMIDQRNSLTRILEGGTDE